MDKMNKISEIKKALSVHVMVTFSFSKSLRLVPHLCFTFILFHFSLLFLN
jgi:hypothetical protein